MSKAIWGHDPGDEKEERKIWVNPALLEKPKKEKPLIASEEEGLKKQLEQ